MNVTPSKIMLGLSLAAYAYCSWDHVFPEKQALAAPKKGPTITAGVVNRSFTLNLTGDPFNSVPLGRSLNSDGAFVGEPGKELGDLALQGVMITFAERAAVINGKTVHEGETMKTATGVTLRAKRIGVGYCIVESGGRLVMLKVSDAPAGGNGNTTANANAGADGNSSSSSSSSAASSSASEQKNRQTPASSGSHSSMARLPHGH